MKEWIVTSSYLASEKLLWKQNKDASKRSSWNQMSLPIYQGQQIASAQFRQQLMEVTGDALCVTWTLS